MIYTVKRFSSIDSSSRPITLDLPKIERKLYESGLSKREVDIIIDGLRGCDEPEEIMKWVKTGEIKNPEVEKIMKETGLSFPAAYIESKEKLYSVLMTEEELRTFGVISDLAHSGVKRTYKKWVGRGRKELANKIARSMQNDIKQVGNAIEKAKSQKGVQNKTLRGSIYKKRK